MNEEMVEGEIGIYTCKTKKKEKFLIAFKIINEIGRYELFADLILAQHQSYHRKLSAAVNHSTISSTPKQRLFNRRVLLLASLYTV